jgi:hypothetical protein
METIATVKRDALREACEEHEHRFDIYSYKLSIYRTSANYKTYNSEVVFQYLDHIYLYL